MYKRTLSRKSMAIHAEGLWLDRMCMPRGIQENSRFGSCPRRSFALAYLPTGKPVSIQMNKLTGKKIVARWYDPRDGTWRNAGERANTGVREFVAPTQGAQSDWLLVLDDVAKGYRFCRQVEWLPLAGVEKKMNLICAGCITGCLPPRRRRGA